MNRWLIAVVILGVAGLEFTFRGGDSKAGANSEPSPRQEQIVAFRTAGVGNNNRPDDGPPTTLVDRIAELLK